MLPTTPDVIDPLEAFERMMIEMKRIYLEIKYTKNDPEKFKKLDKERQEVEKYRKKVMENINQNKNNTHYTEKKAKQHTNPYKPRQAQAEQTTHKKGALCEKQHNTVLKSATHLKKTDS